MNNFKTDILKVGEWLVIPYLQTIRKNRQDLVLEPRVMDLLLYFCIKPNQVLSKDELISEVWQTVVSDSAVSRGVAYLRKALGDSSSDPIYIRTVSKKGYQLIAPVTEIPKLYTESDVEGISYPESGNSQPKVKNFWKITSLFLFVALLAVILIALSQQYFSSKQNPQATSTIRPLTTIVGNEHDPSFSPDGKWLAFAHKEINGGSWDILIKEIESGIIYKVSSSTEYIDRHPGWSPDGQFLVFHRQAEQGACEFIVVDVLQKNQIRNIAKHQCQPASINADVIWGGDNNTLFFTDTEFETLDNPFIDPYRIFRYSIDTGKKVQLTNPPESGRGDGRISLSPDGNQLAFLRAVQWDSTQIWILNLDSGEQRLINEIPYALRDFSWCLTADCLLLKGANGQIGTLKIENGDFKPITAIGGDLFAPTPIPGANQIALVQGKEQIGNIRLWSNPLLSENPIKDQSFIESSRSDKFARFSNSGSQVAFISERSGLDQIWIRDALGVEQQITDKVFPRGRHRHIEWSADDAKLLSVAQHRVVLIDIHTEKETFLTNSNIYALYPIWTKNEERIIFTSDQDGDWQLWEMDLKSLKHRKLTRRGGYLARLDSSGKQLYYSKYRQKGIWRLSLETGEDEIIIPEFFGTIPWQLFESGIYYSISTKISQRDYIEIKYFDFMSKDNQTVLELKQRNHFIFTVSLDQKQFLITITQPQETGIIAVSSNIK